MDLGSVNDAVPGDAQIKKNALTWEAAVVEHEAILRAAALKDVFGAQASMRQHLSRSENRWLRALEAEDTGDQACGPGLLID